MRSSYLRASRPLLPCLSAAISSYPSNNMCKMPVCFTLVLLHERKRVNTMLHKHYHSLVMSKTRSWISLLTFCASVSDPMTFDASLSYVSVMTVIEIPSTTGAGCHHFGFRCLTWVNWMEVKGMVPPSFLSRSAIRRRWRTMRQASRL